MRGKQKNTRSRQRFARIPRVILESDAWISLSHGARSVLTVIAAQYHGYNNGSLPMTKEMCARYGIAWSGRARWTRELEKNGLIVRTRVGERSGKRIWNMFAVTWEGIDPGDHHAIPTRVAGHDWKKIRCPNLRQRKAKNTAKQKQRRDEKGRYEAKNTAKHVESHEQIYGTSRVCQGGGASSRRTMVSSIQRRLTR